MGTSFRRAIHLFKTHNIINGVQGMEMNVEKTKVMRISRQPFPVKIIIYQKQLENVESFKYLGSILTNDGRCTYEIK
jgi:hypothetical protein